MIVLKNSIIFEGGGGLGIYHYGVIKTLFEEGMMPRIIAGSSAGSLFAALIATNKQEDLKKVISWSLKSGAKIPKVSR